MRKSIILVALLLSACVNGDYQEAQQVPQSDTAVAIESIAGVANQAIFWGNH